jgi:hypothetical protein
MDQQIAASLSGKGTAWRRFLASLAIHGLALLALGLVTAGGRQAWPLLSVSLEADAVVVPEPLGLDAPLPPATPDELVESPRTPLAAIQDSPDRELEALEADLAETRRAAMEALRPAEPLRPRESLETAVPRWQTLGWLPGAGSRGGSEEPVVSNPADTVDPPPGASPTDAGPGPAETVKAPPHPPAPEPVAARLLAWTLPPALRGRYSGTIECRIGVSADGRATAVEFVKGTGDGGYDRMIAAALMRGEYAAAALPTGPVASILIQQITVK